MIFNDRYKINFSNNKIIDNKKFRFKSFTIVLISVFLVFLSSYLIFNKSKTEREKMKRIKIVSEKIDKIEKDEKFMKGELKSLKKKKKKNVDFVNLLIDKKSFDYIEILNKLENIIPMSCYLDELNLKISKKKSVEMGVIASDFSDLLEFYKSIGNYKYSIKSEVKSNNGYKVKINVEFKDE